MNIKIEKIPVESITKNSLKDGSSENVRPATGVGDTIIMARLLVALVKEQERKDINPC